MEVGREQIGGLRDSKRGVDMALAVLEMYVYLVTLFFAEEGSFIPRFGKKRSFADNVSCRWSDG